MQKSDLGVGPTPRDTRVENSTTELNSHSKTQSLLSRRLRRMGAELCKKNPAKLPESSSKNAVRRNISARHSQNLAWMFLHFSVDE